MDFPVAVMGCSALVGLACAVLTGAIAARCGFPVPDERFRSGTIDGLRGYLALMVMAQHFSIWSLLTRGGDWRLPPGALLSNFGVLSVTMFFMITGFLFYPKVAHGFAATPWRRLYISRAFRILPLQLVVVAIVSAIALARQGFALGDHVYDYPLRAAVWMTGWSEPILFGYQQSAMINAMVLWSLRYEWTFYLAVLPVLAALTSVAPATRRPLFVPIGMILIGYAAHRLHPGPLFLDSLMAFGFGIAVRQLTDIVPGEWLRRRSVGLIAGVALVATFLLSSDSLNPVVLAIVACFFLCIAGGNALGGIVVTRGALVLGECSFGIYMLHGIVLNLFFHAATPDLALLDLRWVVLFYPLLAIGVVLVAIAGFLCVESPMISLGRALADRGRKAGGTTVAPSSVSVAP